MGVYIWTEYVPSELGFTANTASSTVQLTKIGNPTSITLEKSSDGITWSTYTIGDIITLSNIGDSVYFRNTSTTDTGFSIDASNRYRFVITGSIAGSGDITTLLNKNGTTTLSDGCFYALFSDCPLTTPPELPATTLANSCYTGMFQRCTSLLTAPNLPATTLAQNCYASMFYNCTSLTTTPKIQATTLAYNCCNGMFWDCTSLTTLPELPAITLTVNCYYSMFLNCPNIMLSTTQTGEYQTEYRIPITGTGTTANNALSYMFTDTGGTFTGTPDINTTYYTSNTVV